MRPLLNGFYLVDKPKGYTSTTVLNRLKALLYRRLSSAGINEKVKVGHAGTLDPFSTGLLIILVGKATRLSEYIINYEKEYTGAIVLGRITDTLDPDGTVIKEEDASDVTRKEVDRVAKELSGRTIELEVPKFSAVKRNGVRLYELARKGEKVEAPRRLVNIYEFEILDFVPGVHPLVLFRAVVGRGVYLRSLANYFAGKLKTVGMLESLRRIRVGDLVVEEATPLEEFEEDLMDKLLMPMDRLLSRYKVLYLMNERDFFRVKNGAPIFLKATAGGEFVSAHETVVLKYDDEVIAVGTVEGTRVKPEKVLI